MFLNIVLGNCLKKSIEISIVYSILQAKVLIFLYFFLCPSLIVSKIIHNFGILYRWNERDPLEIIQKHLVFMLFILLPWAYSLYRLFVMCNQSFCFIINATMKYKIIYFVLLMDNTFRHHAVKKRMQKFWIYFKIILWMMK